jgi:hypothetical protein
MQIVGEAFGVDAASAEDKAKYGIKPASLSSIFDVFLTTQKKRQVRLCGCEWGFMLCVDFHVARFRQTSG